MKKHFVYLMFLFGFLNAVDSISAEPNIKAGSMSLYAGLTNINEFGFDNFIGFQFFGDDGNASWFELGLNSKNLEYIPSSETSTLNNFSIAFGFSYFVFQNSSISAYFSPELGIGVGYEEFPTGDEINSINFDGGLNFGIEWWALSNISFRASTFLGYTYNSSTKSINSKSTEVNSWNFGIMGDTKSKFIISFNF